VKTYLAIFCLVMLALSARGADGTFISLLPQTNSAKATDRMIVEVPGLGANSTHAIEVSNLFSNRTLGGTVTLTNWSGVRFVNRDDNLSSVLTNLANDSTLLIGNGDWTNAVSHAWGNGALGLYHLVNKTNISIWVVGNATLWNTDRGDGLVLSNCSKIRIIGWRSYGWRQTNVSLGTNFAAIVVQNSKEVIIEDFRIDNAGDHTISEFTPVGLFHQSTNITVRNGTIFNSGSWWATVGSITNYDGSLQPGSHWTIQNVKFLESAFGVEFYGPSVPVVTKTIVENCEFGNIINNAIWDGGQTNNYYHTIRNNLIWADNAFRTVSSNTLGNLVNFGVTRGLLFEGNTLMGATTPAGGPGGVAFNMDNSSNFESSDITFRNNTVTNNVYGMQLKQDADDGKIRGVKIADNFIARIVNGAMNLSGSDILVEDNVLEDTALVGQSSMWGGIATWASTNIIFRRNVLRNSPGVTSGRTGIFIDTSCNGCAHYDNIVTSGHVPRFSDSGVGTLWTSGVKARNGGTNVVFLSGTRQIDFGRLLAGEANTNHITVTGAGVGLGDVVHIGASNNSTNAGATTNVIYSGIVYLTNVVQVTALNNGAETADPGDSLYRAVVQRWAQPE
jgi:hypothetical protein